MNLFTHLIDFFTREGDVVAGTNSNEHPRLNSFELRFILKVNNFTKLSNINLKCSNLVNSLSINNVYTPILKQNTIILKQDDNSLTSCKLSNVSNIIRINLVTIDNDCSSIANTAPRLVRNDGFLAPDEYKCRTFATIRPPSFLPHLDFNKYSSHTLPYHQIANIFSNPITSHPFINVITVPVKFWRKKHVNE